MNTSNALTKVNYYNIQILLNLENKRDYLDRLKRIKIYLEINKRIYYLKIIKII